ncbi:MAG: RluA family pseudouridine synthase [Proteobacteria bacterium]|nr:RluA family pseudouridine synthase [Pseudomonadota bacterium]
MVIDIRVAEDGKRADSYISSRLNLSRNRVQESIKKGKILLNGKVFKPSTQLKPGDIIYGEIGDVSETIDLKPLDYPLRVLYEDEYIIVIDKPRGIVVHPAKGHLDDTIVNALLKHCKDLKGIGGELRPGIVHRLDKDTAGVMVIAKDDKSYYELQRQFKDREVEKRYLALIYGVPKKAEDTIVTGIGRSERDRKKFSVKDIGRGKEAISHYKLLKTNGQLSLVEIIIKTGRTHQIRVHMSYMGTPIIGDKVYGKKNFGGSIKDRELMSFIENVEGQLLLACELSFLHPFSKEKMTFKAHIPEEMKKVIDIMD